MKFKVPLYQVDVTLVQVESKDDADVVKPILNAFRLTQEDMSECCNAIRNDETDGSETYRNTGMKTFLVVFYRFTNERIRMNVWSHEKRYVEDRILEMSAVGDIESAGLLAGFLGEKFYEFNKLIEKK